MEYIDICVGGKTYKLAKFTPQQLGQKFINWAKTVISDPLEEIAPKLKLFPVEIQKEMVKEAMSKARVPLTFESPEVKALAISFEGAAKVAAFRLQEAQPELSDQECLELLWQASQEYGAEKFTEIIK